MSDYWLDDAITARNADNEDSWSRQLALAVASDGIGADIEVIDEPGGAVLRGEMTGYDYDTATVSLRVDQVRLLTDPEGRWTNIAPATRTVATRLTAITLL